MRILIISTTFSKNEGGATGIAYQHAIELKKRGYDVFVFAGTVKKDDLGWHEEYGIKVYKIINKNYRYITRSYLCLYNLRIQKELKKFLENINPSVIHSHNLYPYFPFFLLKIAKKTGAKVFFTAHDVMTFSQHKLTFFADKKWNLQNINQVNYKLPLFIQIKQDKKAFNPFRNFFIRHYLKYCDKIFAVSYELRKALNQNKIKNVEVIHNGIDVENWMSDNRKVIEIKRKLNLDNKKVILFAGRLSSAKGGKIIIDVMAEIIKQIPKAILLVLGNKNSFVNKMEKEILNRKLENNIIFIGYINRSEIKNYYALADIVVVPSIYLDPFPTINLEAMACHKPVIATIFGGSREVVADKKTGFIVNPLDINIFLNNIFNLKDREKIKKVGKAGFEKIKKDFSKKEWVNKIISFYK